MVCRVKLELANHMTDKTQSFYGTCLLDFSSTVKKLCRSLFLLALSFSFHFSFTRHAIYLNRDINSLSINEHPIPFISHFYNSLILSCTPLFIQIEFDILNKKENMLNSFSSFRASTTI